MPPVDDITDEIRNLVVNAKSVAIWPMDEYPLSEQYEIAAYLQDRGLRLYPLHDIADRILDEQCYRDIRLIPDDYDILLLFTPTESLPETINAIFNADYIPPLIWTHTGIHDIFTLDRLIEAGINVVMDEDLMVCHKNWTVD